MEATLAIAAERGYDGTSIALVMEATGLPGSSIYWHFKNKDELLAETVEYSYAKWREISPIVGFPADRDDPVHNIKDRLVRASRAISASPEFWRLGLMLGLRSGAVELAARQRYIAVRAKTLAGLQEWYERLLPDLGPDLAERLTRCTMAMLDGLYLGSLADPGWWEGDSRDRMLDLLAEGLYATALKWVESA